MYTQLHQCVLNILHATSLQLMFRTSRVCYTTQCYLSTSDLHVLITHHSYSADESCLPAILSSEHANPTLPPLVHVRFTRAWPVGSFYHIQPVQRRLFERNSSKRLCFTTTARTSISFSASISDLSVFAQMHLKAAVYTPAKSTLEMFCTTTCMKSAGTSVSCLGSSHLRVLVKEKKLVPCVNRDAVYREASLRGKQQHVNAVGVPEIALADKIPAPSFFSTQWPMKNTGPEFLRRIDLLLVLW